MKPKATYSGLRFDSKDAKYWGPRIATAFREYLPKEEGTVVLGSDTRYTSPLLKGFFDMTLYDYNLIDIGISPTPSLQWVLNNLVENPLGGVMVTGSHNDSSYNGLKILQPNGLCLNSADINWIFNESQKYKDVLVPDERNARKQYHLKEKHIKAVHKHIEDIEGDFSKIKVAIDTCNGAARDMFGKLLEMYGCDVYQVDKTKKRYGLTRHPEPTPNNLKDLRKATLEQKCDIGFATDSDGDRLAIVDENGNALKEAYSLAFSIWYVLKYLSKGGNVVTNLSTTRMIDDVVERFNGNLIKKKVGELNIADAMMKYSSKIGGEGNGGVIYSDIGYGRDAFAGAPLILNLMDKERKKISELVDLLPKYEMIADKIENFSGNLIEIEDKVEKVYDIDGKINKEDGLRIDFKDGWLNIRQSNTEPIVRLHAEAKDWERAVEIIRTLKGCF